MLKKYADDNGFTNIFVFANDGYSGTNFDRPDWNRLMELVDGGRVGIIIVKDMRRKIRAVFKAKGQSGKALCTNIPHTGTSKTRRTRPIGLLTKRPPRW